MMAAGIEYNHGRHIAAVQAAARAAGIRGAAFAVLAYMCSAAAFRQPTVRVSKDTIAAKTGYHKDTVQDALRVLREAGFIHPVAFATGGRHLATVYSLRAGKGVENAPPFESVEAAKGGVKPHQKGGQNPVKRGGNLPPPSTVSSNDPSRVERGAYSAGVQSRSLDARQGGGPGTVLPLTDRERALVAAFAQDMNSMGYGEARQRDKDRRAQADGGQEGA